ncbi:hypothetical protein VPBB_1662 [Vibrio parahaemolyticus BB22OP]|nr:hypothetical protein VPBB_1662 [Vibrio parahaemolyticus BB22OP]
MSFGWSKGKNDGSQNTHNKAFKRDSQRLAVSVQSLAFVFMAQWFKLGGIALFTP